MRSLLLTEKQSPSAFFCILDFEQGELCNRLDLPLHPRPPIKLAADMETFHEARASLLLLKGGLSMSLCRIIVPDSSRYGKY